MMNKVLVTTVVSLLICTNFIAQNVDSLLTSYSQNGKKEGVKGNFNGVVLIANNDSIVFNKAYGFSNFKTKELLKSNDRFLIGSVTKPIVASLVLKEVEKGNLNLDQDITDFLPYFEEEKGKNITIHTLLSHTSGLSHYSGLMPYIESQAAFFDASFTPDEYAKLINRTKLVSIPGEKFSYSSLGYILLGAILEKVTNKTFAELIESEIVEALELENTGFRDNSFIDHNLVKSYLVDNSRQKEVPNRNQTNTYTAGGVHSNTEDLFRIVKAFGNKNLLNKELTEKAFTPVLNGYSYGWFRNDPEVLRYVPKARFYAHGGRVNNYSSYVMLNDDGTTIVMLSNSLPLNPWKLVSHIYRIYKEEDLSQSSRLILPSLRNVNRFNQEGGVKTVKEYQKVMTENAGYPIYPSSSYLIKMVEIHRNRVNTGEIDNALERMSSPENPDAEDLINRLAYFYLDLDLPKAEKYFVKATQLFPKSANVWDGLGEYYEKIKNNQKAIEAYSKAVYLSEKYFLVNEDLFLKNLNRVSNEK